MRSQAQPANPDSRRPMDAADHCGVGTFLSLGTLEISRKTGMPFLVRGSRHNPLLHPSLAALEKMFAPQACFARIRLPFP